MLPLSRAGVDQIRSSYIQTHNDVEKMVFTALLACFAALLQSMGGFFPGIGYLFSPFSTAPLFIITWLSPIRGLWAYFLTIGLLWIIQPSELVVFPFTTGLLGIVLGVGLQGFHKRSVIIFFSGIIVTLGIDTVLVVLQFPLLGPVAATTFSLRVTIYILAFSLIYSWLWLEGMLLLIKRLFKGYRRK